MARLPAIAALVLLVGIAACDRDKPGPTAPAQTVTTTGLVIYGAPSASMERRPDRSFEGRPDIQRWHRAHGEQPQLDQFVAGDRNRCG
jgi:hypothetical protein